MFSKSIGRFVSTRTASTTFQSRTIKMSSSIPSSVTALVINDNKVRVAKHAAPKIRDSYVLAQVDCIALNPTDWKHISRKIAAPNGISGCDFSGTVVEVGPGVSKSLKAGDRIAATTHGANFTHDDDGCFAEYAVAKGDLVVKIPDSLSFEQAATFPLGVATVGQGLYQKALKLKLPTEPTTGQEWVLIYVSHALSTARTTERTNCGYRAAHPRPAL